MTREEAKAKLLQGHKAAIRARLHRYNPEKYPAPPRMSRVNMAEIIAEAWLLHMTLMPDPFDHWFCGERVPYAISCLPKWAQP